MATTTVGQEPDIMDMTSEHIQVLVTGSTKRHVRAHGTLSRRRQEVEDSQLLSQELLLRTSTAVTSQVLKIEQ